MRLKTLVAAAAASATTKATINMASSSKIKPVHPPQIDDLRANLLNTHTARQLDREQQMRDDGQGAPHTDAKLRLFGASPADVRVTLYRDTAAWCPYCQKVWLLLEEKEIPFRVEKINMRSYGDKPAEFLDKVPGGFLPAIELDGELVTDSLPIMQLLDATYADQGPRMVPPPGSDERARAEKLLRLERELFRDWCTLTFQPGQGIFGAHAKAFLATLRRVDAELGADERSVWFLGGEAPSLVDLQYVSHVERMVASVAFWKGIRMRDEAAFPNLEKWLRAFEERPAYLATKSDMYTHVMDIPPQYGPGYGVAEADEYAKAITGRDGVSWSLPLRLADPLGVDRLPPKMDLGAEAACHEAAYKLLINFDAVARFAARGSGQPGRKRFQAPLADPYALPDEEALEAVAAALRFVACALIDGTDAAEEAGAAAALCDGGDARVVQCLGYLRDRVGVPRDMSAPAAIALRAHLNWAIEKCSA